MLFVSRRDRQSATRHRAGRAPGFRGAAAAFTLIEIAIVIFILTVVALLVAPRLHRFLGGDARSAARDFAGLVGSLVQEAIASHRIQRLHYDLDTDEFWVTTLVSRGGVLEEGQPVGAKRALPSDVEFEDVITPHQGLVTEGQAFTQFFPSGAVTRTTIHLKERDDLRYTLMINPITGRVHVFDRYLDVKPTS